MINKEKKLNLIGKRSCISVDELLVEYQRGVKICIWGAGYLAKTTCKNVLKILNIEPFCFCDNNKDLIGTTVFDEIKVIDSAELYEEKEKIIWIICVRIPKVDEVMTQLISMGFKKMIFIADISCDSRVVRHYFPFMENKAVAYTCIINGYDQLHYPSEEIAEKYDCVLISDRQPDELRTYKEWIDAKDIIVSDKLDNTRINRYCKINAHKIFPHYYRSIYLDGNIQLKKNLDIFLENNNSLGITVLSPSGYKDVYREASHKMNQTVENGDVISKQMEKYWSEGLPEYSGSWYCGILVRNHNSIICKKLMEEWWEEVVNYSKRDQLSLPYVIWKNGYNQDSIKTILCDSNFEKNDYFEYYLDHKRVP